MKNGEFGNYGICNPDGRIEKPKNEGKLTFENDRSGYIRENASANVEEMSFFPAENYGNGSTGSGAENAPETATSAPASKAAPSVNLTNVTTVTGGGIAAVGGVLATAAVAAVIVVATVLSILSVNVSLILADVDRLVFQLAVEVEISEGEGEAEMPVFTAKLQGEGYSQEQTVASNAIFEFTGLQSNREYFLTVAGEDGKIYVEKSYCTAAIPKREAYLEVFSEGEEVHIFAMVELAKNEIYTLTAKDADGNVLFAADGNKEDSYSFRLSRPTAVSVTLRVGNEILAAEQIEEWSEPSFEYLYGSAIWDWSEDGTSVTVTVPEANGGEPLILSPLVGETIEEATCEEAGAAHYTASITDENEEIYQDEKIIELSALGHEYGELLEEFPATCSETGLAPRYCCSRCEKFFDVNQEAATEEDLTLPALGHAYGELLEEIEPFCEEDGRSECYCCSRCEKFFDANKNPVEEEDLLIPSLGHDYGDLMEGEEATCEEDGVIAHYCCQRCENFFNENKVAVEDIMIPSLGHDYGELLEAIEPTCEEDGTAARYCCLRCEKLFDANKDPVEEPVDLAIPALGHSYGEPVFVWSSSESGAVAAETGDQNVSDTPFAAVAMFTCARDSEHVEEVDAVVTMEVISDFVHYTATVVFEDHEYSETKSEAELETIVNGPFELTLHFHPDDGEMPEDDMTQVLMSGECPVAPDPPVLEGFTFLGWFEYDGEEPYAFDTPLYYDLDLYARYEEE